MLSEKEKYYIKMSDIAAITKEKVEDARAEGEKLGEVRGKAEGEQTKQREIAVNMLAKGMEISLVSELTGLSEDGIRQLQQTNTIK